MYTFFLVIHIMACIFLIAVILFQAGRGGGLSESFGRGAMQNIFGSSSTTILAKATAVCAVLFIITSLSLTILTSRRGKSLIDLQRGRLPVSDQEPVRQTAFPSVSGEPEKTVTVREVRIDPQTGKEIVVKEEKMTPEEAAKRKTG